MFRVRKSCPLGTLTKKPGAESEAREQGTIWSSFCRSPYSWARRRQRLYRQTNWVERRGRGPRPRRAWRGTQHRQARGRGAQHPAAHVEYENPFFRIGDLREELTSGDPRRGAVGEAPQRQSYVDATRLGRR